MSAVVASNLIKRFGEKLAVADTSFAVGDGEFLVLVGPSGCGKTTTLRLLAGLEAVTSGDIAFGERIVTNLRPRDRDVAMVFQDYAIFPHLTVFENIAYGLRSRHAPRQEIGPRVNQAARTFRIDHLLGRKPRQLSGGERQRVALSRAMVRDAAVYLYDEPLSNLDAQLRYQAREDVLALHRAKRRPSIYVTHDQSEAMALGDRIAVMRDGTIQQIGTGDDLYSRPRNRFVAFFIGTPSINLFNVEVRSGDEGEVVLQSPAFSLTLPARCTRRSPSTSGSGHVRHSSRGPARPAHGAIRGDAGEHHPRRRQCHRADSSRQHGLPQHTGRRAARFRGDVQAASAGELSGEGDSAGDRRREGPPFRSQQRALAARVGLSTMPFVADIEARNDAPGPIWGPSPSSVTTSNPWWSSISVGRCSSCPESWRWRFRSYLSGCGSRWGSTARRP